MKKSKNKIQKYELGSFTDSLGGFGKMAPKLGQLGTFLGSAIGDNEAGNALAGAGSGATMGASLGSVVPGLGTGLGAIAGGVLGGISGVIGGAKRRRLALQKKQQDQENARQSYDNSYNSTLDTNNTDAYGTQAFKNGGMVEDDNIYKNGGDIHIKPENKGKFTAYKKRTGKTTEEALHSKDPHVRQMANFARNAKKWKHADGSDVSPDSNMINIERGELLIDPDKGNILQEYKGINPLTGGLFESHAKKQTNESPNNITIANPGTFVITKKKAKLYKDAVDNNDQISKDTILMNIRNHKIAIKGGLGEKKYADGGDLPSVRGIGINPQYDLGLSEPFELRPQTDLTTVNPNATNLGFSNVVGGTPINANIIPTNSSNNNSSFSDVAGGVLDNLTKYAPSLYNIGQGLFGKPALTSPVQKSVNPYTSRILANMPQNLNTQPIINEIYANQNTADSNLRNNTNSSAIYRANRQQLTNNTSKQLANVKMQAQEANNQIAGQRAGIYGQLGSEDIREQDLARQLNLGIEQQNNAVKANKQNILGTGLSQLQQIGQNDRNNTQRQAMEKYNLQLLSQIFPNLRNYGDFNPETLFKQLGR